MLLRCANGIDCRYGLLADASLIEFVSGFHTGGNIHERYGIVMVSVERIVNLLAISLSYVEIDSSLDDIISKVGVREWNDPLNDSVLALCFFPFGLFGFHFSFSSSSLILAL